MGCASPLFESERQSLEEEIERLKHERERERERERLNQIFFFTILLQWLHCSWMAKFIGFKSFDVACFLIFRC